MGDPPSCCVAMLYYYVHEFLTLLLSFSCELIFYTRCIDDVFGVWYHGTNKALNNAQWKAFTKATPFGWLQ